MMKHLLGIWQIVLLLGLQIELFPGSGEKPPVWFPVVVQVFTPTSNEGVKTSNSSNCFKSLQECAVFVKIDSQGHFDLYFSED